MTDKRVLVQFTALTFFIAYAVSAVLIVLGPSGYRVYNWVHSLQQFAMNIPFAIYILSPAIASCLVLKKHHRVANTKEWLLTVFRIKGNPRSYLLAVAGLTLYFSVHVAVSGHTEPALPFSTLVLSLPGSLLIGGLEEAGWMYPLQPGLEKRYGFALSGFVTGIIWILWHIPLFFIPGTNHGEGLIDFWIFAVQLMAFRFFNGAIYKLSEKGRVFPCVFFHTLFNAASPIFGAATTTWAGTIFANTAMVLASIAAVAAHNKKARRIVES